MVAQAEEAQAALEESVGRTDENDASDDFSDLSETENDLDLREMIDNPPKEEWKTILNEIYNQGGTVDDAVISRQVELNDFSPEAEARVRQEISEAQDWVNSRARKAGDGGDADSDLSEYGRRRSSAGQDPNRTPTDIKVEQLVTRLDSEIRENGEGSESAKKIEGEIKELLVTEAHAYARKMGLVTRNADGTVNQVLVDPAKIELVRGDETSSYGLDDVIRINLDNSNDPTADMFHEMKHRAEMLERTAMRLADPASYDLRVQQDVFGELSQGGNKRIKVIDGEVSVVERTELTTKEQKQQLASLLTEFGQSVTNIESASREQINGWLADRAQVDYFGQQGIDRAALVDLMSQEIASYRLIRDQSILPSSTVQNSSALSEFLGAKQQSYARLSAAGQPVAQDPRAIKLTNGITEETIGVAGDESHYNLFSPSERRAESADLARSMGIKLERIGGDADLGSERAVMQLHQTALALNTALAKHRATSDLEQQRELWSKAEQSAQKIVDILPENDLGREVTRRLVDMQLIDNNSLPPGLRVEETSGRRRVSTESDTAIGDLQRRSSSNPLNTGDSAPDAAQLVRRLRAELKPGQRLEGQRLEKVRDKINQLMEQSPEMRARLQPFVEQLQPPEISGRSAQVKTDLNSTDQSVRDAAVRTDLIRLMNLSSPTRADVQEVTRLRRNLFESMKADNLIKNEMKDLLNTDEVSDLWAKQDAGTLTDAESKRLSELESMKDDYDTRTKENLRTMIEVLKLEGQNEKIKMGTQAGGKSLENEVFRMFEGQLKSSNYEIIPMPNGSFIDDVGFDMILVDKTTGDFVPVDPTTNSLDSEEKRYLPKLRKDGVISSHEENYLPGQRDFYLHARVQERIAALKAGSPLNLADIALPASTREGQATNSLRSKDRLKYIERLPLDHKIIEIRQFRTELLERRRALHEINDSSWNKEFQLKREARREKDQTKSAELYKRAQLLHDWRAHTDRKPLGHIDFALRELAAIEQGLPPEARRFTRVPERPGQKYDVPPGLEQALNDVASADNNSDNGINNDARRKASRNPLEDHQVLEELEAGTRTAAMIALRDELQMMDLDLGDAEQEIPYLAMSLETNEEFEGLSDRQRHALARDFYERYTAGKLASTKPKVKARVADAPIEPVYRSDQDILREAGEDGDSRTSRIPDIDEPDLASFIRNEKFQAYVGKTSADHVASLDRIAKFFENSPDLVPARLLGVGGEQIAIQLEPEVTLKNGEKVSGPGLEVADDGTVYKDGVAVTDVKSVNNRVLKIAANMRVDFEDGIQNGWGERTVRHRTANGGTIEVPLDAPLAAAEGGLQVIDENTVVYLQSGVITPVADADFNRFSENLFDSEINGNDNYIQEDDVNLRNQVGYMTNGDGSIARDREGNPIVVLFDYPSVMSDTDRLSQPDQTD
ncbi:MAG: hypothetical protein R3D26_23650 [Cyanobacteriota/Melainabacteria group bacterium]